MGVRKFWENEKVKSKRAEIENDKHGVYKYIYPVVAVLFIVTFVVVAIMGAF